MQSAPVKTIETANHQTLEQLNLDYVRAVEMSDHHSRAKLVQDTVRQDRHRPLHRYLVLSRGTVGMRRCPCRPLLTERAPVCEGPDFLWSR
jgi:hypothetical protein